MGKLVGGGVGRVLECFLNLRGSRSTSSSCFCMEIEDEYEFDQTKKPLIGDHLRRSSQVLKLKDIIADDQKLTLAVHLKPKVVVLRVSMHCSGCARKVEKHISKMEGVDSYKVDLESKMVVVTGDIFPFEVLQSVSKVKTAEILNSSR